MITLIELREKIADNYDEITILELLEINAEDLVVAFSDRIEDRFEKLSAEFLNEEAD
jgi:hypothetical protein